LYAVLTYAKSAPKIDAIRSSGDVRIDRRVLSKNSILAVV
jgi:hypothetical protein